MAEDRVNFRVQYGKSKKVKWRDYPEGDPDDELLEATPEDVIKQLGFDPKEFEEGGQ